MLYIHIKCRDWENNYTCFEFNGKMIYLLGFEVMSECDILHNIYLFQINKVIITNNLINLKGLNIKVYMIL